MVFQNIEGSFDLLSWVGCQLISSCIFSFIEAHVFHRWNAYDQVIFLRQAKILYVHVESCLAIVFVYDAVVYWKVIREDASKLQHPLSVVLLYFSPHYRNFNDSFVPPCLIMSVVKIPIFAAVKSKLPLTFRDDWEYQQLSDFIENKRGAVFKQRNDSFRKT